MIKKAFKHGMALAGAGFSSLAIAVSEETGTHAVAEMDISGGQFVMLLGGVALVGVVLWLVVRLMNK